MQKFFELRPSRSELATVRTILLLAAFLALIYVDPGISQCLFLLAIVILIVGETQAATNGKSFYLVFDGKLCGIVDARGQQPYFSSKNKVYPCRWFAILKLYNRHKNRIEILFPDRFISIQAYQECRYLLSRLQDS